MVRNTPKRKKNLSTDKRTEREASGGIAVSYEDLWYIRLRGDGSKLPAAKWGGYDQDFEAATEVFTHAEAVEHPCKEWGVVGVRDEGHRSTSLLIFDVDSYKAPDSFDVDRLKIRGDTLVTRSQSGGLHVYVRISEPRGSLSESDFDVHSALPFDVDIRGSAVSHHVVAPADIPGFGGEYDITGDNPITSELGAGEACTRITLDGEPAVTYDPQTTADIEFDAPADPPESMPRCVQRSLAARAACPESGNTHKVNVYAGLCGLAAGYNADELAGLMCGEFAPVDAGVDVSDKEETQRQLEHLEGKLSGGYSPPALSSLRNHGILGADEDCGEECPIGMHHERSEDEEQALKTVYWFTHKYDPVSERPDIPQEDDFASKDAYKAEKKAVKDEHYPDTEEIQRVADAVTELTESDYDEFCDDVVSRVRRSEDDVETHRELSQKCEPGDLVNHGESMHRVGRLKTTGWVFLTDEVLNFRLEVESRLDVEGEGVMADVTVTPSEPLESEFSLQIAPRQFNDARRFKDAVLDQRFSTTIKSDEHDSDTMDRIRQYVARQDVPHRTGQKQMGLSRSGDEFVAPTGVIGRDGWVDSPETVYIERDIGAERKFVADPDTHDGVDRDAVGEMIELFSRTRDPERFVPVLGWLYAAPLRQRIVDRADSFNLLFISGESGVGKTGTLKVASRLFGMSSDPFSASDTTFATITTLASSRGVPVWIDEYKESDMADWQKNKLQELFRKAATGGVEQRGNADKSTEEYYLRAPTVVTGETRVHGSAEQRRAIDVAFRDTPTQPDSAEFDRFKTLVGDATTDENGNVQFPDTRYEFEEHAVAYYSYVAGIDDEEFEEAWFAAREYVSKRLAGWNVELDDLEIQGLQTVAFGFRMMREFAETVGADASVLPGEDELDAALRYVADVDGPGRERHIDEFVKLLQRAQAADYLDHETHWDVVHAGGVDEELRLNVSRCYDAVSKFVRDHDIGADLLGGARDYRDRFGEEVTKDDSWVECASQNTPPIGRCVGVRTADATEQIDGFDGETFFSGTIVADVIGLNKDDTNGGSDNTTGDSDNTNVTPVAEVDPNSGTDYDTVTVRVAEWQAGPDGSGLEWSGTVVDESGAIRVVTFDSLSTTIDEGDYVRLRRVQVDEFDGTKQLIIDGKVTVIQPIQAGAGHTEMQDTGDEQQDTVSTPLSKSNSDGLPVPVEEIFNEVVRVKSFETGADEKAIADCYRESGGEA